eukprot:GHVN01079304.1.p2 GENE.GHVN01079304.1~~GHVN01079304.1.p2  ORF type:complete len:246 (+),score=104.48 GHVN01079304.1:246-983(+)
MYNDVATTLKTEDSSSDDDDKDAHGDGCVSQLSSQSLLEVCSGRTGRHAERQKGKLARIKAAEEREKAMQSDSTRASPTVSPVDIAAVKEATGGESERSRGKKEKKRRKREEREEREREEEEMAEGQGGDGSNPEDETTDGESRRSREKGEKKRPKREERERKDSEMAESEGGDTPKPEGEPVIGDDKETKKQKKSKKRKDRSEEAGVSRGFAEDEVSEGHMKKHKKAKNKLKKPMKERDGEEIV